MAAGANRTPADGAPGEPATLLPVVAATSQFAEVGRPVRGPRPFVPPRTVPVGVVVFDLDGTILDDLGLISAVAADVLEKAFGTPAEEARIHYLATTGMPFEAQLSQLYPEAPAALRATTARTFHQRKVTEAYAKAKPFPEVPKMLSSLDRDGWTLAIATGSEGEMADLILEREGLRYWFDEVLGSGDGTKHEHLEEYQRRYSRAPMFLVGDSRFDMEAAAATPGVVPVARASRLTGWTLSPLDLRRWGAAWADYSLAGLPSALPKLLRRRGGPKPSKPARARRK